MDGFDATCILTNWKASATFKETWKSKVSSGDMTVRSCLRQYRSSFWVVELYTLWISLLQAVFTSLCNASGKDHFVWPYWGLIFGYNGKSWRLNGMLLISVCFDMIHSLVIWVFPSFRWLWWKKNTSPHQRGGWPSLSRFVFPSQLASLRGKSKSVGSEAGHYDKTSHLPNVWRWDKKAQMTYFLLLMWSSNLEYSKDNELSDGAWKPLSRIQTLKTKICESQCIMGDAVPSVCQCRLMAQMHTGCICAVPLGCWYSTPCYLRPI